MTMTDSDAAAPSNAPIDAITERLNEPAVAAALVTVLDNAELLSTLVLGLGGLVERGDMIMDAVAEGVGEIKAAGGGTAGQFPSVAELGAFASRATQVAPLIDDLLASPIATTATIAVLSDLSEAAAEGRANALANGTTVEGVRGAMRVLKDPEVQRGLGLLVEIARALGRRGN